jgi:radical SAM superfamily enzyme YgiQ (UPF0313 family)
MKVMLVSLPGINESDGNLFPLGIGYLSAALKNEKHHVESCHYSNMTLARKEIPSKLELIKPDILGFTCSTFNRGFVKEMIQVVLNKGHNSVIVVGGVHASFCYKQVLIEYCADIVVIGEGDVTICELCGALELGQSLTTVSGIAFLDGQQVTLTSPRQTLNNLDDLSLPDYTYARPFIEHAGMAFMITSRGCPVQCTFCSTSSYWGQKVRMNSVTRVVDEIEMLISEYNVKKFFFHDDTFNIGISRVMNICSEIVSRGIDVEWGCSCRVTPVSVEMLSAMVRAGCRHICWGIESGSVEMLARIDKKISLSQIRNAYELSKKFSDVMSTGAFTMVGNPGESLETIGETIRFLNTIPITDHPSTSILYVLPGTLLYENLKQAGHVSDVDWVKNDTVPYYTIENSFSTLSEWAIMVSGSGNLIPFDRANSFWGSQLCPPERDSLLSRVYRVVREPGRIVARLRSHMPAGKIRF